jgi:hypothetical protein
MTIQTKIKNQKSKQDTAADDNNILLNVPPKPQAARKRKNNLPKPVTVVLKQWLTEHCKNPYLPTLKRPNSKIKLG